MLMPIGGPVLGIRGAALPVIPGALPAAGGAAPTRPSSAPDRAVVQGPLTPAADGDPAPLPYADLVPQMTGLVVASGAVALGVAARRRALKAYEAAIDPDEGLRRVADADEADQVGA